MAILGSLRKNSVVLITVIGMALFAFVISGVFDGKGYTSQDPIGMVNDQDLSIEEFRNQVDFLERSYNLSGMNAVNSVWDQTVRNLILKNQFELSGVDSGKDHLEYILSQNPSFNSEPSFLNDAKIFEIEKFIDLIVEYKTTNPDAYEQWKKQESIFQSQSNEKIYFDLISSGINFSYKDGEFEYLLQNDRVDIEYVQIPYSSIPDSLVKLKNSDVQKYIKSNHTDFKIDASRSIEYVLFEEKPSIEDENETKSFLESFLVEKKEYNDISKQEETIPSLLTAKNLTEFINQNSEIKFDSIYVPKGSLPNNDANILFNLNKGQNYGPYLDDEYFKISRMLDKKKGGNIRASHILISFKGSKNASPEITRSKSEARKEANRILKLVRKNPDSFSGLAFEFSDGPSKSSGGDLGFFQEGAMVKPFNDFVFSKKEGTIGVVETDFGFHVINIVAKEDLVLLASIAIKNIPSENTSDKTFNLATKFEINLSKNKNLNELARENNHEIKPVSNIKILDDNLPGLTNQRRLVQWLFSEEVELNSYKRFDLSNGGYLIAQVTDLREEGLSSVEDVTFTAVPKVRNQKKAELIIKQNKKNKSLEDLANNNNTEIKKALALNQKNATISGAGREPLLVGHAFGLKVNQISDFIIGENGVYKIKVTKKDKSSGLDTYSSYQNQLLLSSRPSVNSTLYQAVKESAEIIDNRSTYY
ncbi:MAG: peptidylprolyl isomerase [Flavobacteriaceae bacterium]|nr:peptidylprolyl isomerase [Flavobacteriaceae bacterium]